MKLWKVLGIIGGVYGLVGPMITIAGFVGASPDWRESFCVRPPLYTFVHLQKFFGCWGHYPVEMIIRCSWLDIFSLLLNASLWLLVGVVFGLLIQKSKRW